jgi:hypothetical protein
MDDERQRLLDRERRDCQGEEQPGSRDSRRTEFARRVANLGAALRSRQLEIPANENRELVDEVTRDLFGGRAGDDRCGFLGYRPASTEMRPSLPASTSSA